MAYHEKIRVGVLRGGPSSEYEVSLKSGARVLAELPPKYQPIDIYIDRDGVWHFHGVVRSPHDILRYCDVVFNALHGEYGEDGGVQHILETHAIPFSGSGRFASAFAMNKITAKGFLERHGIKTPLGKLIRGEEVGSVAELAGQLYRSFPQPSMVKPLAGGSSLRMSVAETESELEDALEQALSGSDRVLVEEFILGREATCGVINQFRGENLYALFPTEIVPPSESRFFDYYAKYSGQSKEICPGNFSLEEKQELQELAKAAHRLLDLRHYSRSDFIIHPRRGIYFLEVNTLPGLTEESLLPKALEASGATLSHFLDHVVTLALARA